ARPHPRSRRVAAALRADHAVNTTRRTSRHQNSHDTHPQHRVPSVTASGVTHVERNTVRRTTTRAGAALTIACLTGAALFAGSGPASSAEGTPAAGSYLAPFHTTGDLTGDNAITQADVDLVAGSVGAQEGDAAWAAVAPADLDDDGTITVTDVAGLSRKVIYDDGEFELVEASVLEMQAAMNAGVLTSVELTQQYLDRIETYDRAKVDPADNGRPLNSIISTNPEALA